MTFWIFKQSEQGQYPDEPGQTYVYDNRHSVSPGRSTLPARSSAVSMVFDIGLPNCAVARMYLRLPHSPHSLRRSLFRTVCTSTASPEASAPHLA